ncbi:SURF1 family protein [Roseateles toxinivorans]|uniref:SURF1-like protein n=1 Tax=Roseateles toxinivorans TaxID=270368 RepID=A0A4R6QP37_9BURK|nr:SURF1 family protein [Roseateles toxinivorans]TDP71368.1 cytochrome oxidase assembly protein ShyY1 [Roseateles toxinivorans]
MSKAPSSRAWVVLLAALLAVALTARLGFWQLDRAAQKQAMQTRLDERAQLPELKPSELALNAAAAPVQYERHVRVRGRWLTDKTVFLDNRPMAGRVGFYVLTPLLLDDGTPLLVLRGWAPRNAAQRAELPALPTPAGLVEVWGKLGPTPSRLYQFGAAESGTIRQNVDLSDFARETGLALRPLVLQQLATPADSSDGLLRQWPAPAVDIHKHYGYAFQWFALSTLLVGLYIWFQIIQPRRKGRIPS